MLTCSLLHADCLPAGAQQHSSSTTTNMGNEVSMLQQSGRGPEEMALMKAVLEGDVPGMQALLQQKQGLIYAHSKDGENIWHAAAQGGHPEVRAGAAFRAWSSMPMLLS